MLGILARQGVLSRAASAFLDLERARRRGDARAGREAQRRLRECGWSVVAVEPRGGGR
jgi:hypothetical protein